MPETCSHLDQIKNPSPNTEWMRGVPEDGRYVGAFAPLRNMRPRGVLRLLKEQTRHEAFPTRRSIRLCGPLSRAKIGDGATWMR